MLRRSIPRVCGLYAKGVVENVETVFTIDSGASSTLVATRLFNELSKTKQYPLVPETLTRFEGPAEGQVLHIRGRTTLTFTFGDICISAEVVIADIRDDVLVGADILLGLPEGPFNFLLTEGRLEWNGLSVDVVQVTKARHGKVCCLKDYVIQGHSEELIEVEVSSTGSVMGEVMIEPSVVFQDKSNLAMACSLNTIGVSQRTHVRLMNPFPRTVTVRRGTVVGEVGPIPEIHPLMPEEDHTDNVNAVRRLILSPSIDDQVEQVRRVDLATAVPQAREVPEHLQELWNNTKENVSEAMHAPVEDLLCDFGDTFSKHDDDLGCTHLTVHHIDTGDARPIKQVPRRTPAAFEGRDKEELDRMLERGTIRKSNSPWSSPIVVVPKKNGKLRICCDYRKLNNVTKKDAFPLPKISDCLDAVSGSMYFSTLDLTSGYNQVRVAEEDIPKTAFVTKYGLFESPFMSFGLCNAPATFQRVMELALQGLQWATCLIYIDDIIVFSATEDEHLERLRGVLQRLQDAGLKVRPSKCFFFEREVVFLGHIVSGEGVKPNPTNVDRILSWDVPTSTKQVRQFLGMATYYRRFIKDFAKIAEPLAKLTSKNVTFTWSDDCMIAFNKLKAALTGPSVMAYPLTDSPFILDTDASDTAIGAVLSQIQNGEEKVVAYASRSMNKAERNYCVTDKELLAVKHFIEYFYQYLMGRHFVCRTDHQPLRWLFSLKEPRGRVARWLQILADYSFEIEYRKGIKHNNADAMSRCPNPRMCQCNFEDENESILKCGPCRKCQRKSEQMKSSWDAQHPDQVSRIAFVEEVTDPETEDVSVIFAALMYVCWVCTLPKSWLLSCWDVLVMVFNRVFAPEGNRFRRTRSDTNTSVWFQDFSNQEIQQKQRSDPVLKIVIGWLESGKLPKSMVMPEKCPELRHYYLYYTSLSLNDGLLCRTFIKQDGVGEYTQVVVPTDMRESILKAMHDTLTAGHLGQHKTMEKLLQHFYWFKVREDVKVWVSRCEVCQSVKVPTKGAKAPLGRMIVGGIMDRLCTDLMGPLPLTPRGNKHVLVVTDSFSKWTEIFAVPDETAETCARVILNEVISRFGCPLSIHSDQGRCYESHIFKELCTLLEVRKTRTTPRNPKCNGQTERFNKTLVPMIRAYLRGQQNQWD